MFLQVNIAPCRCLLTIHVMSILYLFTENAKLTAVDSIIPLSIYYLIVNMTYSKLCLTAFQSLPK